MANQQQPTPYRVLARKYRPRNFDEVIGQDALIRTLRNAIESNRIHHAYMLTGIRGTGKTTTARLIARALNYTGADGKAGPTTGPTDDCAICQAIAEDRCPDVMEMDAASRTGVDDIREILDGVRYAPTAARYKIYIIDEVHMLSKNAFNALLKTLEEPPPRVIFIFATTEIRKVPVTVLSRCQRFDLRRVDAITLSAYYGKIAGLEKVQTEDEALAMIARAADGSVRDGLSLLDQAIALGGDKVSAAQVRGMLGLGDRQQVMDLLEMSLKGDTAKALGIMDEMYKAGADPVTLMQDLLDLTHILTRLKAVPDTRDLRGALAQDMTGRATALAGSMTMPVLGRTWQLLLKGLGEVSHAPDAQAAAEMAVIRLIYASGLPDPADLLKKIKKSGDAAPAASYAPGPSGGDSRTVNVRTGTTGGSVAVSAPSPQEEYATVPAKALASLADVEALLQAHREARLASDVYQYVHLIKIQNGKLDIRVESEARKEFVGELRDALSRLTGTRWNVILGNEAGSPTLAQQKEAAQQALRDQAAKHPVVAEVLRLFPGTEISVRMDAEAPEKDKP